EPRRPVVVRVADQARTGDALAAGAVDFPLRDQRAEALVVRVPETHRLLGHLLVRLVVGRALAGLLVHLLEREEQRAGLVPDAEAALFGLAVERLRAGPCGEGVGHRSSPATRVCSCRRAGSPSRPRWRACRRRGPPARARARCTTSRCPGAPPRRAPRGPRTVGRPVAAERAAGARAGGSRRA